MNGIEPELGFLPVSPYMTIWGLIAVTDIEEEPIRPDSQYGWHRSRLVLPLPNIDEMPGGGGRGGHGGGNKVRAAAFALAPFEIAVARAGAALAGLELVGVHGQAHAAAGLAPVEARFFEDSIEAFLLSLLFHLAAAGDDHRVDGAGNAVAFDDGGSGA